MRWSYVEVRVITLPTPSSASARGSAASKPAGQVERTDAEDGALAGHESRYRLDRAEGAGIRDRHRRADEVVRAVRAAVNLANEFLVGEQERAKVHGVRVLNDGHEQVVRSIFLYDVHGQAEADVLVVTNPGRALVVHGVDEGGVERGNFTKSLDDREGDEVGEGDLRSARARERLVERGAVDLQESRGDGAHAGRRRHREARVHVGDDARGRPTKRRRLGVDTDLGSRDHGGGRTGRGGDRRNVERW